MPTPPSEHARTPSNYINPGSNEDVCATLAARHLCSDFVLLLHLIDCRIDIIINQTLHPAGVKVYWLQIIHSLSTGEIISLADVAAREGERRKMTSV